MTGHTYLIIKASRSLKSDIKSDKPYYKVVDITPVGVPFRYLEKRTPYMYETTTIQHSTSKIIEIFAVKVESEDQIYSTVHIKDWASHPTTAEKKLIDLVNAIAVDARREYKHARTEWLYDRHINFRGAVVKTPTGCVWIDIVRVPVQPLVYGSSKTEEVLVNGERTMIHDGL